MVAPLRDDLRAAGHDLAQMVFTLDALHTQHATANLLYRTGAGYVMTVKGNQPRLRAAVIARLRDESPTGTRAHSRGHGRTEERRLAPRAGGHLVLGVPVEQLTPVGDVRPQTTADLDSRGAVSAMDDGVLTSAWQFSRSSTSFPRLHG